MFSSLNDMFIFGRLGPQIWDSIFAECAFFLDSCRKHKPETFQTAACEQLYLPKTLTRLKDFHQQSGIPIDVDMRYNGTAVPSLTAVAHFASQFIPALEGQHVSVMHGDFCFSNILYDSRARQIRVVDPRGFVSKGQPTIYGDGRYDLAKVFHSAVGFYDLIIAGYFEVSLDGQDFQFELIADDYIQIVHDSFLAHQFGPLRGDDPVLVAIAIHLFLSMVPLHADHPQRQLAFLANAYRLYLMLREKGTTGQ